MADELSIYILFADLYISIMDVHDCMFRERGAKLFHCSHFWCTSPELLCETENYGQGSGVCLHGSFRLFHQIKEKPVSISLASETRMLKDIQKHKPNHVNYKSKLKTVSLHCIWP